MTDQAPNHAETVQNAINTANLPEAGKDSEQVCSRCEKTTNPDSKCTVCRKFLCTQCGHQCRECHSQCCGQGDCQYYLCEICELPTCSKCSEVCLTCRDYGQVTHCNSCAERAHSGSYSNFERCEDGCFQDGDGGDEEADFEGDEEDAVSTTDLETAHPKHEDGENRSEKRHLPTLEDSSDRVISKRVKLEV
jgi:hypothetical protein